MRGLNLIEAELSEETDIEAKVFCSPWFNSLTKTWTSLIWGMRNNPAPANLEIGAAPSIEVLTPAKLLECLEDPSRRSNCPIVKWRGKILPEPMIRNVEVDADKDKMVVNEFLFMIGEIPPHNGNRNIRAARQALQIWSETDEEDQTTFCLIREKELDPEDHLELAQAVGRGMKKRIYDETNPDTKQPDYKTPTNKRYHPWFDCLLDELASPHHKNVTVFDDLLREENKSEHPMSRAAQLAVHHIMNIYNGTNCAMFASKLINTYSRLGGSYLPKGSSKSNDRSALVIFPIYSTCYRDGAPMRSVSGLLIRGPHHARHPLIE